VRRIIVFSGTDGAGKTTQIELLEKELLAKGVRISRFWARGGYTPLFRLAKRLLREIRPEALPQPGRSTERSQKFSSQRLRKVWLTISILDLILCYAVWLRLKSIIGLTVICDRYIEDTLLDFRRNFPSEDVGAWFLWKLLEKLAPIPACRYLLVVPPAESQRRSELKKEPFPDSMDTLIWRYEQYMKMAETEMWHFIDCTRPIQEVWQSIQAKTGL
jgi:thymidylate kinase